LSDRTEQKSGWLTPKFGPLAAAFLTLLLTGLAAELTIDRMMRHVAPTDDRSAVLSNLYDGRLNDEQAIILIGGSAVDELTPWSIDPEICGADSPLQFRKLTFGGQSVAISLGIVDHLQAAPGSLLLFHVNYFRMGGAPGDLQEEMVRAALPLENIGVYSDLLAAVGMKAGAPVTRLQYHAPFLYNHAEVRTWALRSRVRAQLTRNPLDILAWRNVFFDQNQETGFRPTTVRFDVAEPLAAKLSSLRDRLGEETAALRNNMDFNLAALAQVKAIAERRRWHLVLIDTPQDPALFPATTDIRNIYEETIKGYDRLELAYTDLRFEHGLQTNDFRDLVHVVTSGRVLYSQRWNSLLADWMSGRCKAGNNG
jgi:hypothetical protein